MTPSIVRKAAASTIHTDDWVSVFDGKSLAGWKANEKPESIRIQLGWNPRDRDASK